MQVGIQPHQDTLWFPHDTSPYSMIYTGRNHILFPAHKTMVKLLVKLPKTYLGIDLAISTGNVLAF